MVNDEQATVALPKLYGAPAYARPAITPVTTTVRPFDPDSLPLDAHQTDEEREISKEFSGTTYTTTAIAMSMVSSREGVAYSRGGPSPFGSITRRIRRTGSKPAA